MTLEHDTLAIGRATYGDAWAPNRWALAPGRMELLGNHVDYSGGLVLAAAIDRRISIASTHDGNGGTISIAIAGETITLVVDDLLGWRSDGRRATTVDYLRGIVAAMYERNLPVRPGIRLAIAGDVPIGFGMSSSAALCVASVLTLTVDRPLDRDLVLIAQEAEHRAGSPVGAMDQSASVAGDVILFDSAAVSWTSMSPNLDGLVFCVAHSGVSHALSESSYPVRVRETTEILALIQEHIDPSIANLSDVDWVSVADVAWLDSTQKARVRHIVTERDRVREGIDAVRASDWTRFGDLMRASGRSSAVDYEISDPIVEELVADLNAMDGVLGARMMGGGEGGPALALVRKEAVPAIRESLATGFYARHPVEMPGGAFQVCAFGPGATVADQYPAD